MKVFKYNRWLVLVIVIGLLAALAISFQRNAVERANRQVDLAIDYEGLQELAQREGLPESVVLEKVKEAGISSWLSMRRPSSSTTTARLRQLTAARSWRATMQERSRTLHGANSLPPARSTARKSTSSATIHRPIRK